jgi:hypothetical protein
MTLFSLQALGWGTVAGAVASTLLLAAREPAGVQFKPSRAVVAPHAPNAAPAPRMVSGLMQAHPEQTQVLMARPR